MRKLFLNKPLVLAVAFWSLILGIAPSNSFAMPTDSAAYFSPQTSRQMTIDKIMTVFSRPEARAHLMLMGLNQEELRQKLSGLDDRQLTEVAGQADAARAGGDGLGVVIAILVIALLVILIVKLADKTVVVKD
ncbi:MAG: PA2779 family protein [Candidatus Omnitrophica bacterium]|nr:PA2779 family protein [Candidatus Omnitrophota bacterium]